MAISLPQDYKREPPDFKTVSGRVNAEDMAFLATSLPEIKT